ncbi:coiled-coil domain-containing protein 191-like [Glandiceps talaboti]
MSSEAVVRDIEECDEESSIDNILHSLMEKNIVEEKFLSDLGLDDDSPSKGNDPTLSMQVRHQKVKENREKRIKEKQKQLREKQRQKDAQFQAQQMIVKEERHKAIQRKKEESLIQQEMTKIRKEMEEQRQMVEETHRREREVIEAEKHRKVEGRELKKREEELRRIQTQETVEKEKMELLHKLKEMKSMRIADNLKTLKKHFSAWYKLVIDRRIQMGKARALSDWRLLVKVWNSWRHYVRHQQIIREEKELELNIRESYRKNQASEHHYRLCLLKKCFVAWQLMIMQEQRSKELLEKKQETKDKMSALLQAAASGQLWTNRSDNNKMLKDDIEKRNRSSDWLDSSKRVGCFLGCTH